MNRNHLEAVKHLYQANRFDDRRRRAHEKGKQEYRDQIKRMEASAKKGRQHSSKSIIERRPSGPTAANLDHRPVLSLDTHDPLTSVHAPTNAIFTRKHRLAEVERDNKTTVTSDSNKIWVNGKDSRHVNDKLVVQDLTCLAIQDESTELMNPAADKEGKEMSQVPQQQRDLELNGHWTAGIGDEKMSGIADDSSGTDLFYSDDNQDSPASSVQMTSMEWQLKADHRESKSDQCSAVHKSNQDSAETVGKIERDRLESGDETDQDSTETSEETVENSMESGHKTDQDTTETSEETVQDSTESANMIPGQFLSGDDSETATSDQASMASYDIFAEHSTDSASEEHESAGSADSMASINWTDSVISKHLSQSDSYNKSVNSQASSSSIQTMNFNAKPPSQESGQSDSSINVDSSLKVGKAEPVARQELESDRLERVSHHDSMASIDDMPTPARQAPDSDHSEIISKEAVNDESCPIPVQVSESGCSETAKNSMSTVRPDETESLPEQQPGIDQLESESHSDSVANVNKLEGNAKQDTFPPQVCSTSSKDSILDAMVGMENTFPLKFASVCSEDSVLDALGGTENAGEIRASSDDSESDGTNKRLVVVVNSEAVVEKNVSEHDSSATVEMLPAEVKKVEDSEMLEASSDLGHPVSELLGSGEVKTENVSISSSLKVEAKSSINNPKEVSAIPEPYITASDLDNSSQCSSSRGSASSLYTTSTTSSDDSLGLCGESCFLISDYSELIGGKGKPERGVSKRKMGTRPHSGKRDSGRFTLQNDQSERKPRASSAKGSTGINLASMTSSDELEGITCDREDLGSVLSDLAALVKQPLESIPAERRADIQSLVLSTEEELGIAADMEAEHPVQLEEKDHKLSEQKSNISREAVKQVLKPVLVSKTKCYQSSPKQSKSVRFSVGSYYDV